MSSSFVKKACVFASISSACIKSRTTATPAIPVVAIGGLTSENIDQLAATGIAGVAVVRDLMQAEDIEAKTQAFLTKLDDMIS